MLLFDTFIYDTKQNMRFSLKFPKSGLFSSAQFRLFSVKDFRLSSSLHDAVIADKCLTGHSKNMAVELSVVPVSTTTDFREIPG